MSEMCKVIRIWIPHVPIYSEFSLITACWLVQLFATNKHMHCMVGEKKKVAYIASSRNHRSVYYNSLNSAKLLHFISQAQSGDQISRLVDGPWTSRPLWEEIRAENAAVRPAVCCWTMCFDVFHRLNCWQWWGERWRCMSLCGCKKV